MISYIATALLSLLVGLLLQHLKDRPKLLVWMPGSFLFQLREPQDLQIRTDSLTIQNVGREAATNVEVIHQERPDHFQFSTPIAYAEDTNPEGQHIIRIRSIGPKEYVNLQFLSHITPPVPLQVRSDAGPAQLIQVQLHRIYPRWAMLMASGLILLGGGFAIYWLGAAILFISRRLGIL